MSQVAAGLESPTAAEPAGPGIRRFGWLPEIATVLVPIVLWFAPLGIDPVAQHSLAILSFMVIAWMTEVVEHALAGLIGCFLFWALGIVKFGTAFSGFANDTSWFMFGAILIGLMATRSGLARRLAYHVMLRVGTTYPRILLGLIISDFLLTFAVPSGIARVVIMASVALGLVEAFGAVQGSNIGRGMFLVLTYTATIFDKMIVAGAASITARGLIDKVGNVDIAWSLWFLAYLPCALATILFAWWVTLRLYPPEKASLDGGADYLRNELRRMGRWGSVEKRAALLTAIAVGLWLTDFLHHISPAIVGLGVGLCAVIPQVGILDTSDFRKVNYLPFIFVAAAVSLGDVLQTTHGVDVLANTFLVWAKPLLTNTLVSTFVLYWAAFLYHLFLASEIPMMATSIPPLMIFAKEHGLSPMVIGMIWAFSAGGKLFAYQTAVLIVGYSYGFFNSRNLLVLGGVLTVFECVLLVLSVTLYWPLIGIR